MITAVHAVHFFLHVQGERSHQPPEDDTHIIQEGMVGICIMHSAALYLFPLAVEVMRDKFMIDTLDTHHGRRPWPIRRENVYNDVVETYQENLTDILQRYLFRIRYENKRAVDSGGVCRDMFSCFWEKAYLKNFNGKFVNSSNAS